MSGSRKTVWIWGLGDIGEETLDQMLAGFENTDFYITNRTHVKAVEIAGVRQMEVRARGTGNTITAVENPSEYPELANVDVIIVAAGVRASTIRQQQIDKGLPPSAPDRNLALDQNVKMIVEIGEQIAHVLTNRDQNLEEPLTIVAPNPNDVVTNVYRYVTCMDKVAGAGGALDTGRFRDALLERLPPDTDYSSVEAFVIGPHSTNMRPLASIARVNGTPVSQLLSADDIEQACKDTIDAGTKLVANYTGNGAAKQTSYIIFRILDAYFSPDKRKHAEVFTASIAVDANSDWMQNILNQRSEPIVTGVPFRFTGEDDINVLDHPAQFLRGARASVVLAEVELAQFEHGVKTNIPFQKTGLKIYGNYLLHGCSFDPDAPAAFSVTVNNGLIMIDGLRQDAETCYCQSQLERVIRGIFELQPLQNSESQGRLYYKLDPEMLNWLQEINIVSSKQHTQPSTVACTCASLNH